MKITVHGPPGAGNRLVGRMLNASPHDWTVTVMHLPGRWYPADAYVFTDRSTENLVQSILKERMVSTKSLAFDWVHDARNQIEEWVDQDHDRHRWCSVYYDEMVRSGAQRTIAHIAHWMKVDPWPFEEEIYDANAQYAIDSTALPGTM